MLQGLLFPALVVTVASSASGMANTTAIILYEPATILKPLTVKHRSYVLPPPVGTVKIRQQWGEGGAGTGSASWDGAELLAWVLMRLDAQRLGFDTWQGVSVVELGAGLGLASIVAAKLGARVLCTDGDELVVPMAMANLRDAGVDERVASAHLPWGAPRSELQKVLDTAGLSRPVRVVMLADVLYTGSMGARKQLAQTLLDLTGPESLLLLQYTERYKIVTEAVFLILRKHFTLEPLDANDEAIPPRYRGRPALSLFIGRRRSGSTNEL